MKVPAFEWDNSVKIEVAEIKNVRKTALVFSCNNQARVFNGQTETPVSVYVYEQRNRYHYLAKVGADEDYFCYSTEKRCDQSVVAGYIASILDGTYTAED